MSAIRRELPPGSSDRARRRSDPAVHQGTRRLRKARARSDRHRGGASRVALRIAPAAEVVSPTPTMSPQASPCTSTCSPPFSGGRGLYLEDLFVVPSGAGMGWADACSPTWRAPRSSAVAGAWNGRCSTGTSWRWASTGRWAPGRWSEWTVQRLTGAALHDLASSA